MSLRIWLPMTKDLRNQGLSEVTVTNNGATFNSAGKLGGCYSFDGSDDFISLNGSVLYDIIKGGSTPFSIAMWIYRADSTRAILFGDYSLSGGIGFNIELTTAHNLRFYWNGSPDVNTSAACTLNTWSHVAIVYDGTKICFYVNGSLNYTHTVTLSTKTKTTGLYYIGRDARTGTTAFNGRLNDFRLYDHCLSPMEVKELAKGLVLHYPLNRQGLGATNLLKNGFGELNRENWSNSNVYTDVPSGHSEIYKSYRDNESVEFIPLLRNCTYKFSAWLKAASSSGKSYPSLKPYDVDKLFISTYNCREGFNLNTMTTLKQQLKPGDTKIYVNDLSQWNANSGHYYDVAAIFSYTDGHGYTWPDGIYTRNCPAFATGTNAKTNLDKTNNIITLLSAYTGPTMPVGTKVCASTYGLDYFYPLGGPANSTITDWTYKEGTFSSQHVRLECAKYIRVYAYSTCYQAGMTLSNITANDWVATTEYDCSGFCNNGIRTGTFTWTSDTPKYNVSTQFSGTQYIRLPFPCSAISEAVSVAVWGYESNWNTSSAECLIGACTKGSGWCIGDYGSENTLFAFYANGSYNTATGFKQLSVGWHHFVITFDGLHLNYYVDGQLFSSKTFSTKQTATGNYNIEIGRHYGDGCNFKGRMSDVRIYATALSADDVRALYENSAYIDSSGNVYGAVHSEV